MIKKPSYEKFKKEFGFIRWSDGGPLMHIAHAAGLCSNAYTKLCEKLSESYEIIGMDFRGHGRTSAPAKPAKLLNWEPFYKDLEDFFRNQNQPIIAAGTFTLLVLLLTIMPGPNGVLILKTVPQNGRRAGVSPKKLNQSTYIKANLSSHKKPFD